MTSCHLVPAFVISLSIAAFFTSSLSSHGLNDQHNGDIETVKLIKIPLKRADLLISTNFDDDHAIIEGKRLNKRTVDATSTHYDNTVHNNSGTLSAYLKGTLGRGYYVEVLIGTPSQSMNVLVDTGSSNFAVATTSHLPFLNKSFNTSASSTFTLIGEDVTVPYMQGEWMGAFGREMARIRPIDDIPIETTIGFITQSNNFFISEANWQGIWGLGYGEIARPQSRPHRNTFWDDIVQAANIPDVFSLSLCDSHGSLTMGGVDREEYRGDLHYVLVRKEWYYDVTITDVRVGNRSLGLDCKEYNFDKVIIDSGTTYLYFPPTAFNQLIQVLVKASKVEMPSEFWYGTEISCFRGIPFPWNSLPNVSITFFGSSSSTSPLSSSSSSSSSSYNVVTLVISPRLYVREVYTEVDHWLPTKRCYRFSIAQSQSAGIIIGAIFMEGFYTVFDRENKRIGFAVSSCAMSESSDAFSSSVSGEYPDCAYDRGDEKRGLLNIFIIICVAVCSIIFFPLSGFLISSEFCKKSSPSPPESTAPANVGSSVTGSSIVKR